MAETAVTEQTCGICLEDSKHPLTLPCSHSFCDGCLNEWRSRYGVDEEMRTKCPICRARIPPSKEMVRQLLCYRAEKGRLEEKNDTSSEYYHRTCQLLKETEEDVGADWDGVTVLQDNYEKQAVVMPDYVFLAIKNGDIKLVLKWINANRTEDRVNAVTSAEYRMGLSALQFAAMSSRSTLMTLLLQLGADIDHRNIHGYTAMSIVLGSPVASTEDVNKLFRMLLTWGASFFSGKERSKRGCASMARGQNRHEIADLLESELGGRRCEIVNLSSRPELNGKTCIVDKYHPDSNQYRVTLETKSKESLIIGPDNLKRRDRTPQDCGYYVEFKNGRTIRHDFDSSEDCQAFVAALNRGETQPAVTDELEARAEQAAAELLAELGLDDPLNNVSASDDQVKKSKKKKGGKKKKRQ